jgi:hypothetical protein
MIGVFEGIQSNGHTGTILHTTLFIEIVLRRSKDSLLEGRLAEMCRFRNVFDRQPKLYARFNGDQNMLISGDR